MLVHDRIWPPLCNGFTREGQLLGACFANESGCLPDVLGSLGGVLESSRVCLGVSWRSLGFSVHRGIIFWKSWDDLAVLLKDSRTIREDPEEWSACWRDLGRLWGHLVKVAGRLVSILDAKWPIRADQAKTQEKLWFLFVFGGFRGAWSRPRTWEINVKNQLGGQVRTWQA